MTEIGDLKAGVVGTGFIGVVHVDALRRLGVEVLGVVGSTPERAAAKGIASAYESLDALLADDRIDVVHVTTPNALHFPQVRHALAAGKHVVCEKPLAVGADESAELVRLAEDAGVVHCTNFHNRFYPIVQDARERVRAGELGAVWSVHGGYLQDWLAYPTDWNWRLEIDRAGELRVVGDVGTHWLDTAQFVTGLSVVELLADLATVIPTRQRPVGEVETFSAAGEVEREDVVITTDDLAHILLRFENGARGSVVLSQVAPGRKNSLADRGGRFGGSAGVGLGAPRGALARTARRAERRRAAECRDDAPCRCGTDAPSGGTRRRLRRRVPRAIRRCVRGRGARWPV